VKANRHLSRGLVIAICKGQPSFMCDTFDRDDVAHISRYYLRDCTDSMPGLLRK